MSVEQNPGTKINQPTAHLATGEQRARPASRTVVLNFGCTLEPPGE